MFTIATGRDMEEDGFANDEHYAKKVAEHLNADLELYLRMYAFSIGLTK
jgi:hypothetical protein